MTRIFALVTLLILASINVASAQMGGGMGGGGGGMAAPAPIPEVDGETLIYQPIDKWYPYSKQSEAKADVYLFPTGQKPEKWKELMQFETFFTTLGVTDASQVFDLKTGNLGTSCESHTVTTDKDADENGYYMHQWSERCSTTEGEMVTTRKTILGTEKLYLASKIWKYEPKDWEVEKWTAYLDQVYVCDGTEQHHCRPPNRPAGGRGGEGMGGR